MHGTAGQEREQPYPDEQQGPDDDRGHGDHQLGDGVCPEQAQGDDRDTEDVAEVPRMQAGVELQQDDGEAHGGQGRQVVAKPLARDPQDQDGEDRRHGHDRELGDHAGRVSRAPNRHGNRGQQDAEPN